LDFARLDKFRRRDDRADFGRSVDYPASREAFAAVDQKLGRGSRFPLTHIIFLDYNLE
jgi:hypothetical protein